MMPNRIAQSSAARSAPVWSPEMIVMAEINFMVRR